MKTSLGFVARCALAGVAAIALSFAAPSANSAGGGDIKIDKKTWSFSGPLGIFDTGQLQRGYVVYKNVCASCHSMNLLSYRNLAQPGGPNIPEESVKALAAEFEVPDGVDEDGEPKTRPAILADRFVSPYKTENEAREANGGAYPPDLSVIAKARSAGGQTPFYLAPFKWVKEIATGYEESGANYLYALLVGYLEEAPEGVEMQDGMYYNKAYPGHQIAMPNPLSEDVVEYNDGTKATVPQMAEDVTAFMMWAAEPTMVQRKQLGVTVITFLTILALLLYFVKKQVWARLKH